MRGRRHIGFASFVGALALMAAAGVSTAHADARASGVSDLKGDFEFGMTPAEVMGVLAEEIRAEYAEKIDETPHFYRQDELRRERQREIQRLRDTYVEFEGERTGWDVSLIEEQFAHDTGESMLVRWESDPVTGEDRRRFFFFHEGELYKMFFALNPSGQERPFSFFQNLLERRFGSGDVTYEVDALGNRTPAAIDWESSDYRIRALNKLEFYGSFALVLAEEERARRVASAREGLGGEEDTRRLEDVIAEDPDRDQPELDEREHVVDTIIRQR